MDKYTKHIISIIKIIDAVITYYHQTSNEFVKGLSVHKYHYESTIRVQMFCNKMLPVNCQDKLNCF